ncbi:MAG: acyltransferase [Ferruginibacter sp.]
MANTNEPSTLTGSKKLYGLDHLRAFAVASVCLFHYGLSFPHPSWLPRISGFGWTGVDLFFVLSGYLIASQLFAKIAAGKPISISTFFIKRFFRIIPAYLFVLAIYFCIPYAREWEALAPLWKFLTFTYNIAPDLRIEKTFGHSWSLCIEEQFYLLLPALLGALIYFKAIKKAWWLLAALFVFGFIIRLYSYQNLVEPIGSFTGQRTAWYKWIYFPTYCRLDGLLTGVSIAALFEFRPLLKERICRYGNLFLIAGSLLLAAAWFLARPLETYAFAILGFPLVSIAYGAIVIGAVSPVSFLYKYDSKLTATVASLSYAAYLVHKIMIHITQDLLSKAGVSKTGIFMFAACVIAVLLGAFVVNVLVEKPFLRMRKRLLDG